MFGDPADLDLYVTDPAQETVYFANSPSVAGGVLEADRRCDDPAPRSEIVRFAHAPAGAYRVGVDYPERCGMASGPIPFLVVAEAAGLRREARGQIELGRFLVLVLEFELAP